jgi:hypothetical protein
MIQENIVDDSKESEKDVPLDGTRPPPRLPYFLLEEVLLLNQNGMKKELTTEKVESTKEEQGCENSNSLVYDGEQKNEKSEV